MREVVTDSLRGKRINLETEGNRGGVEGYQFTMWSEDFIPPFRAISFSIEDAIKLRDTLNKYIEDNIQSTLT